MKRLLLAASIAAALSTPAFAAPETFVIDNNHTFPSFSYSHFGYTIQTSRFNKTSGKMVLDKAAKTGSVDVVIDTLSVDTGSPLFNEHIQEPDFLDTARYPTATFKSTKVTFDGDKPATIDGDLTLKGITRAGDAQGDGLSVHAPPDGQEGRDRRQRHDHRQAHRLQCRQVRALRRRRRDDHHRDRSHQGMNPTRREERQP